MNLDTVKKNDIILLAAGFSNSALSTYVTSTSNLQLLYYKPSYYESATGQTTSGVVLYLATQEAPSLTFTSGHDINIARLY